WGSKSAFTNGTFEALLFDALKDAGRAQSYTRLYGRMRAVQSSAVLAAALGAAVAARWGYGTILAASLVSVGVASLTAFSLPPTAPASSASGRGYLAHLRLGLSAAFRSPPVLSILAFSAIVLALGAALEEFWPIFGAKVGLSRPVIAVFVGGQSLLEALASLAAFRFAAFPRQAFHLLFALAGAMLLAASALFTAPAMLLLAAYSGLMKLIAVVFEGRLQHAIGSESRATVGSAKSLVSQIGVTALYLSFGPIAQASSYRIAFMACGLAGLVIALGYLARAAVRSQAPEAAA
ncbi:MAG: hypothetical protein ACREEQ_08570, partial [Caulobacteraceae bacterium]